MRPPSLRYPLVIAILAAATAGACAAGTQQSGFTTTQGGGGPTTGSGGSGGNPSSSSSGQGNGGNTTITITDDGGTGDGGVSSAYANTNTVLFKLDPSKPNLALSQIGDFDCIGGTGQDTSMNDIAVNEAGDVWGISSKNVYKLVLPPGGTGTVHCALTIPLNNAKNVTFYALTFAPAGLLGSGEVLVAGNTAGELWAVDGMGNLTQHGSLGTVPANDGHGHSYQNAGKAWELSGDIVFLANNGNPLGFATVRDCPTPPSTSSCNTTDTLVELNMSAIKNAGAQPVTQSVRGQIVKSAGCNDPANPTYGSMYGIAAYEDKVFGFSHQGFVVTINNNDGSACLALQTSSDLWGGAAITTVAKVTPPTTQ